MTLTNEIKAALKSGKAIVGFNQCIKFIKLNTPKLIIVSENIPEKLMEKIKDNVGGREVMIKRFNGSSKKLGAVCGKPFPITTIVIKS